MKTPLSIHSESCIRCGRCVRVCPSMIFRQPGKSKAITLQNPETCIVCGHCAAVCPTGSVVHPDFPTEKIHTIDRASLPTPEQVLLLCKTRRSNRAFSGKPVPKEMLEQILEAAHRAPTASNTQQVAFTLITSPEKLHAISDFTIDTFYSVAKTLENPLLKPVLKRLLPQVYRYLPTFRRLKTEYDKGNDLILRNASAVLFIHTPKESRFGCEDANLAYQNGSLMAESLGVSQFYTGFVCSALKQGDKKRLLSALGIAGTVHAGMALGIPDFFYPNYMDKQPLRATWL